MASLPGASAASLPPALLQEAWGGSLPIQFVLAAGEVTTPLQTPPPCYAMVSRLSYLPVAAEGAVAHFRSAASALVRTGVSFYLKVRKSARTHHFLEI